MAAAGFMARLAVLWIILLGVGIHLRLDGRNAVRVIFDHVCVLSAGFGVKGILRLARPVGAHAIAILPAQKFADWSIEDLPSQVPQSNLDAADGCNRHAGYGAHSASISDHL